MCLHLIASCTFLIAVIAVGLIINIMDSKVTDVNPWTSGDAGYMNIPLQATHQSRKPGLIVPSIIPQSRCCAVASLPGYIGKHGPIQEGYIIHDGRYAEAVSLHLTYSNYPVITCILWLPQRCSEYYCLPAYYSLSANGTFFVDSVRERSVRRVSVVPERSGTAFLLFFDDRN